MTVIMMTGEYRLPLGSRAVWTATGGAATLAAAAAFLYLAGGPEAPSPSYPDISLQVFSFLWQYRPWDLLILVMAFASAMVTITNLLSREP